MKTLIALALIFVSGAASAQQANYISQIYVKSLNCAANVIVDLTQAGVGPGIQLLQNQQGELIVDNYIPLSVLSNVSKNRASCIDRIISQ